MGSFYLLKQKLRVASWETRPRVAIDSRTQALWFYHPPRLDITSLSPAAASNMICLIKNITSSNTLFNNVYIINDPLIVFWQIVCNINRTREGPLALSHQGQRTTLQLWTLMKTSVTLLLTLWDLHEEINSWANLWNVRLLFLAWVV